MQTILQLCEKYLPVRDHPPEWLRCKYGYLDQETGQFVPNEEELVRGLQEGTQQERALQRQSAAIRELELLNYKSYEGQHRIKFHPHYTTIIGKNGAGKSNIFDAFNFLFCSRNFDSRAGHIKELIAFESEAPIVKATVTIEDIKNGKTYKISRAGDRNNRSQWQINGSNCRAKDATQLMEQLGIFGFARGSFMLNTSTVREMLKLSGVMLRKKITLAAGVVTPLQLRARTDYN